MKVELTAGWFLLRQIRGFMKQRLTVLRGSLAGPSATAREPERSVVADGVRCVALDRRPRHRHTRCQPMGEQNHRGTSRQRQQR